MCGNSGFFHGKLMNGPYVGAVHANRPPPVDPQVLADQQASIAASQAASIFNRRRIASSLQAGSRGVIGKPGALGAMASTSPGGRGAAPGGPPGSVLGSAGTGR